VDRERQSRQEDLVLHPSLTWVVRSGRRGGSSISACLHLVSLDYFKVLSDVRLSLLLGRFLATRSGKRMRGRKRTLLLERAEARRCRADHAAPRTFYSASLAYSVTYPPPHNHSKATRLRDLPGVIHPRPARAPRTTKPTQR